MLVLAPALLALVALGFQAACDDSGNSSAAGPATGGTNGSSSGGDDDKGSGGVVPGQPGSAIRASGSHTPVATPYDGGGWNKGATGDFVFRTLQP